jgi:uncharacterized protein YjbI with pentapeptide repeats
MANEKQLAILRQGVDAWNAWRLENPRTHIDLREADLSGAIKNKIDLSRINLSGANLHKINFSNTKLHKANLSGAKLTEADLRRADLNEANLRRANLSEIKLQKAVLPRAVLLMANLYKADLSGAKLVRATLSGAILNNANLTGANLSGATLNGADLTHANLLEANLSGANLSEANFEGANLTDCNIYAISAWGLTLRETIQKDLVITPRGQPKVTVDNIEVAQFIYLLLHNEKIREIINTITSKVVLILGSFTEERKAVLDAIREELRKYDYVPVLFDFDKPDNRDLTETVTTLARMARFIIADITDPMSIPLELHAIIPDLAVPVQPLLKEGSTEFSMFRDLRRKYHWVLQVHIYRDTSDLLLLLGEKVIDPAEEKARELRSASK